MIEWVRVVWSMGVPLCSLFLGSELGYNDAGGHLFGVDIDHTGVWYSMFEVTVALFGFMGCRVFGWDNNCYFDTMGKFVRRFFGKDCVTEEGPDGTYLRFWVRSADKVGLHMWGNSGFYFYDGLMLALPEDVNLVVMAHDYLSMIYYDSSLRGRGGSLVLDLSGVSDSMDTRFYYSLRNVIGLVQSSYSFEEIRGIFFGGDYLFNTACMYHFQRMVGSVHSTGDVEKAVLSLVRSNRFWLVFLLHLKNDFYNYLPAKKRVLYAGIVDKVSALVSEGAKL